MIDPFSLILFVAAIISLRLLAHRVWSYEFFYSTEIVQAKRITLPADFIASLGAREDD